MPSNVLIHPLDMAGFSLSCLILLNMDGFGLRLRGLDGHERRGGIQGWEGRRTMSRIEGNRGKLDHPNVAHQVMSFPFSLSLSSAYTPLPLLDPPVQS